MHRSLDAQRNAAIHADGTTALPRRWRRGNTHASLLVNSDVMMLLSVLVAANHDLVSDVVDPPYWTVTNPHLTVAEYGGTVVRVGETCELAQENLDWDDLVAFLPTTEGSTDMSCDDAADSRLQFRVDTPIPSGAPGSAPYLWYLDYDNGFGGRAGGGGLLSVNFDAPGLFKACKSVGDGVIGWLQTRPQCSLNPAFGQLCSACTRRSLRA